MHCFNDIQIFSSPELGQLKWPITQVVELIYATAPHYFDFLFGNQDAAMTQLVNWATSPRSEYSLSSATVLGTEFHCLGVVIGVGGREYKDRQRTDVLALLRSVNAVERSQLLSRVDILRHALPPVEPDDYYIRALSVASAARGIGLGKRLITMAIENGLAANYRRFRLDVRADNTSALKLYETFGFIPKGEHLNPKTGWKMLALQYDLSV